MEKLQKCNFKSWDILYFTVLSKIYCNLQANFLQNYWMCHHTLKQGKEPGIRGWSTLERTWVQRPVKWPGPEAGVAPGGGQTGNITFPYPSDAVVTKIKEIRSQFWLILSRQQVFHLNAICIQRHQWKAPAVSLPDFGIDENYIYFSFYTDCNQIATLLTGSYMNNSNIWLPDKSLKLKRELILCLKS